MRGEWRDGERTRVVEVVPHGGSRFRVTVDDAAFDVTAERLAGDRLRLVTEQGETVAELTSVGSRRFVRLGTLDFVLEREGSGRSGRPGRGRAPGGGLESPMPGVVTRVMVKPGDTVTRGQPLVALEAMKMEHLIRAPRDGRVKTLHARAGEMVGGGKALVELADHEPGGEAR